jgi:hypothetical protein
MFAIDGIASAKERGKKCPYCAEWVKVEAVACKHCGRDISPRALVQARHAAMAARRQKSTSTKETTNTTQAVH